MSVYVRQTTASEHSMGTLPPSSIDYRGIDDQSSIVRTLAVAGVIFGTLGMSCLPFNLGSFITSGWPVEASKDSALDWWCFASTFAGLGLSTILLFSSLGCYHFRRWGLYGILFWAWSSLAYGVVGSYFWGRFLLPGARLAYVAMRGPDEISGLIAWLMGTGLSIIVLHQMGRPAIRGVFQSGLVPAAHRS
jgi:hypothetical protein